MSVNRMNLTEATVLALQGKLGLKESKKPVKENVNVNIDDFGNTVVETDETSVVVTEKQPIEELPVEEVVTEEPEVIEVVEIPVESDETIIPEEVVTEEQLEDIIEDTVEQDETVEEVAEEKIEESVEVEKPTEEWSDDEIAKYVASHYQEITGVEVEEVFNKDKSENAPLFNDEVVDATSDTILAFLDNINITGKRLEEILYKLDDELALLTESCKLEESVSARPNEDKLLEFYESMGYLEGEQGNIICSLISYLSDDDVKDFIRINGYELDKEDEEELEESVQIDDEEDIVAFEVKGYDCEGKFVDEDRASDMFQAKEIAERFIDSGDICLVEIIDVESEEIVETIGEIEENAPSYNSDSFNNVLTETLKSKCKKIESFKVTKIFKSENALKVEGKTIDKLGGCKNVTLNFNKLQEGVRFAKYQLSNVNNLLTESNSKDIFMTTYTNKNNVFECRYVTNK